MARKKNPVSEAVIFAAGTTVGIIVGTVVATWLVESMRVNGMLPGPAPLPLPNPSSVVPPAGYVARVVT